MDRALHTKASIPHGQLNLRRLKDQPPFLAKYSWRMCGEGAMRHFGVPPAFTSGDPDLVIPAANAVYRKTCWAARRPGHPSARMPRQ